MIMTEKFKILGKFIKDLSSETPDIETYLLVKERISKYQLGIDINSKALKNKMIEVITTFKFEDKEKVKKKSHFEIIYSTIVKVSDEVKDKKDVNNSNITYFKKIVKPSAEEIKNHKEYLKLHLKKNYFN